MKPTTCLPRSAGRALFIAAVLGVACAPPPAIAQTTEQTLERLERKVEELQAELERLKRERATAPAAVPMRVEPSAAPPATTTPAAEPRYDTAKEPATTARSILDRVAIGGYGSVRFEENSADDTNTTFDFRRFVLTADARIAPRLRMNMELEFERFRKLELGRKAEAESGGLKVEQEVEGTNQSEITMEQAWFEYELARPARFRIGGVLVPLGRFNLHHDDDRWDLPRRPLVDRGAPALPAKSAWAELGAGFNGDIELGDGGALDYHLYVVNGATLQPEVEEVVQTRDGKRDKLELEAKFGIQSGTFGNDFDDGKAVTGRLAYSPALGHELAGSFYWGRYTPDFLPDESVTSVAFDGITSSGPFELEWEYVYTHFGDTADVARAFAATALEQANATPSDASPEFESEIEFELAGLAQQRHGYWVEGRYDMRPAWLTSSVFGRPFEDPVLTAVVRGEQVWLRDLIRELAFTDGAITEFATSNHRVDRITLGTAYRPVPSVAIQLAYEYTHVDEGSLETVTNFLDSSDDDSHAILFGTAFGF